MSLDQRVELLPILESDADLLHKTLLVKPRTLQRFGDGKVAFMCPHCRLSPMATSSVGGWVQYSAIRCACGAWLKTPSRSAFVRPERIVLPHAPIYRLFSERKYLDLFIAGKVRVSSIGLWRRTEDVSRADTGEATLKLKVDNFHTEYVTREQSLALHAIGFGAAEGMRGLHIERSESSMSVPDAPGLSFTDAASEFLQKKFGRHVVQVRRPAALLERMTQALGDRYNILAASAGRVIYGERELQSPRGHIPPPYLVKPFTHANEREIRFVWLTEGFVSCDETTDIDLGDISDLCGAQ
jgi:hypothetical protein